MTYRYLYGPAVDMIMARLGAEGDIAWYLGDHLGTVRDLADTSGQVIDHIAYDSFGGILAETDPAVGDRFKFTAREFDVAIEQYYYRARYYEGRIGRFTSEDPLGLAAGDANVYRYVLNRPTIACDPSGLAEGSPQPPAPPRDPPIIIPIPAPVAVKVAKEIFKRVFRHVVKQVNDAAYRTSLIQRIADQVGGRVGVPSAARRPGGASAHGEFLDDKWVFFPKWLGMDRDFAEFLRALKGTRVQHDRHEVVHAMEIEPYVQWWVINRLGPNAAEGEAFGEVKFKLVFRVEMIVKDRQTGRRLRHTEDYLAAEGVIPLVRGTQGFPRIDDRLLRLPVVAPLPPSYPQVRQPRYGESGGR